MVAAKFITDVSRHLEFWELGYLCLFVIRLFDLSLGRVKGLGVYLLVFSLSVTAANFDLEMDRIVVAPSSV